MCLASHVTLTTPTESLGIANVDYYWYLNQSGTYTVEGTDDKKDLEETLVSEVLHTEIERGRGRALSQFHKGYLD